MSDFLRMAEGEARRLAAALARAAAERDRLRAALAQIRDMAAEDLRTGRSDGLWQIEADARAALKEDAP